MPQPDQHCDIAIIGAGIAGASVAAELAEAGQRVVLFETEAQPGYHTTGRSAALFTVTYGPPVIRALSRASAAALAASSESGQPFLHPRGAMFLARHEQMDALAALAAELGADAERIAPDEAHARLPILKPSALAGALLDRSAADIDVDALHRHYLRRLSAAGGSLLTRAEVVALGRDGAGWHISTPQGGWRAAIVVNAAGAWADRVATLAGVAGVGLVPKRRTAMLVAAPAGMSPDRWPMAVDVDEEFYLKPDAGRLLLSPADETPSEPCDAQPEEIDIAICIDRIQCAFDLPVTRIAHKWAGLRSFVADGCPVAGYAPGAPGFFWLVGQGGYGIQSAPALARAAAALVLEQALPADIADQGVTAAALAADRPGLLPTRATPGQAVPSQPAGT